MNNQENASNSKDFLGMTMNDWTGVGKVVGDPQIMSESFAFLWLRTSTREQDGNGQWVDAENMIPLIATNANMVSRISNYVKDGRELAVKGYYKSWTAANGQPQHGIAITFMSFGRKKYVPNTQPTAPAMALG